MNRTTNNTPTNGMHNKLKERYTDRKQNKTLLQKLDLDISNDNDDKINNTTTCMLTEVEVNDNEMFQTEMNTERGMNSKRKNQRKYNAKCNKSVNITQNKIVNNIVVNISVQDNNCKHKGLQCIELIGRYVNMYPILEPVIIVIKQILKYGNV